MLEEKIPLEKIPLEKLPVEKRHAVDLTKCYVCGVRATLVCAQCKHPICEEHQQPVNETTAKVQITMCDECADYYEGLVKPD